MGCVQLHVVRRQPLGARGSAPSTPPAGLAGPGRWHLSGEAAEGLPRESALLAGLGARLRGVRGAEENSVSLCVKVSLFLRKNGSRDWPGVDLMAARR